MTSNSSCSAFHGQNPALLAQGQAASTFPGHLIQLVRDLDEAWFAPALKRFDNTLDFDLRIFLRTAVVIFCTTPEHDGHAFRWPEALRIGFVALAAALVWFSMWEPIAAVSVIGVAGLLIGGWPIYKEAFESAVMALSALPESVTKRTWPNRKATLFRASLNRILGAGDREARLRILSAIRLCPVRLHVDRRQAAPDSVSCFPLALRRALFSIRAAWEKLLAMLSGRQKFFVHRDAISDR